MDGVAVQCLVSVSCYGEQTHGGALGLRPNRIRCQRQECMDGVAVQCLVSVPCYGEQTHGGALGLPRNRIRYQ
jgi:hypothetical protein